MILKRLFSHKTSPAETLYGAIVAAARQPVFYEKMAVPDTVDGRFDMIVLHMFLVLERLKGQGEAQQPLRQALIDGFFMDMDRSLREMGVGDLGVGKKVRKMAEAFYGRVAAYGQAIEQNEAAVATTLERNIFAEIPKPHGAEQLAAWTIQVRAALQAQGIEAIAKGDVRFS